MHRLKLVIFLLCFSALASINWAGQYTLSIKGEKTYLNGQEFLACGLRCSNALISDAETQELIDQLDFYTSCGINTVSVFFQGSRFGDVKGYREDASLDPAYAARMGRIIEAADRRGMVVLVGCLYWGNSQGKWESWTQKEANAAVANTVRWLSEREYRNVLIDVDNEGMARRAKGFDNRQMVVAGKRADPACLIATNHKGPPPPEADLALHFATPVKGKPYIQSEASPGGAPGGYWGKYSKRDDFYNYINIGVYNDAMKADHKKQLLDYTEKGQGYLLASTWLQCRPPHGPNADPGGAGTKDDPGLKWWFDHLKKIRGPYRPPPAKIAKPK